VFVGGNYATNSAVLLKMKEILLKINLEPVIADDYAIPEGETIHEFCLMLLHTCRYAIFDVTMAGGQFFEIERTRDYGIKPLIVFNADSISRERPFTSGIGMLEGLERQMKAYHDIETDLEPLLQEYLKQHSEDSKQSPN
jgi:hypothetical protein